MLSITKPRIRIMADHRPSAIQPPLSVNALVDVFGSKKAVAKLAGVSSQAVSQWNSIPPARCFRLAAASNGRITVHDLRPDIFGLAPAMLHPIAAEDRAA